MEDFYRLCVRLVQHCGPPFLSSPNVDLYALVDTALQSLDLPTLAAAGSGSSDSPNDPSTPSTNGGSNAESSTRAETYASTAAARFLLEALLFTTEASEDPPAAIVSVNLPENLPQPSSEASVGARRMLFWLLKPAEACGGLRLTTACIHSCCLGLPDERFPDMADLLYHLKMIMPREIFAAWMDAALTSLPVRRADGLVQATEEQIADFKHSVLR